MRCKCLPDLLCMLLMLSMLAGRGGEASEAARGSNAQAQQQTTPAASIDPAEAANPAAGSTKLLEHAEELLAAERQASAGISYTHLQGRAESLVGDRPVTDSGSIRGKAASEATQQPNTQPLWQKASNGSLQSTSADTIAAGTVTGSRATCTPRPAFRLFFPASVESTKGSIWLVLHLVDPSVAAQLWRLFSSTTACGTTGTPCITATAPAAVVTTSLESSETDGIARVQVSLAAQGSATAASVVQLVLQADPCSPAGTAANLTVDIVSAPPRGTLQLLTGPTLTNSSFAVKADFTQPISNFDVSHMKLSNVTDISSIARSSDSSFVLLCEGKPNAAAKLQLQAGSVISNTYIASNASTNSLAVHVPSLNEALPFYSTAARTVLPIALGVSGAACFVAVLSVPGTPLSWCAPALIRALSHMQILAASTGISRAAEGSGFGAPYAASAADISWALLDNFPVQAIKNINQKLVQKLAYYPKPDSTLWTPTASNGSKLDSWLADIQSSSALIRAYDIASNAAQQQLLQQLPVAARAAAPQLPAVMNITPNMQGLAEYTWSGLISCVEVALCLLVVTLLFHTLQALFSDGRWMGITKGNSVVRVAPPTVQFPLLVLVALLLTVPALLYWVGCLIGSQQLFQYKLAGLITGGTIAGAVYIWILQQVLVNAQEALIKYPITDSMSGSGAAANELHLQQLNAVRKRASLMKAARDWLQQQQQLQQLKAMQQLQQQELADAVAVVGYGGEPRNGQRGYIQQQQQQQQLPGGYPIAEAAQNPTDGTAAATAAADEPGSSTSRSGSLIGAVTCTLQDYQQRLQKFRSSAYLSSSGRLPSPKQEQQQEQQQQQQTADAVVEPAIKILADRLVPAARPAAQSEPQLGNQEHWPEMDSSKVAGKRLTTRSSSSSSKAGLAMQGQIQQCSPQAMPQMQQEGQPGRSGSSSRAVGEASELPSSSIDADIERLQQEQILKEQKEARRRAKVRKQLRQQRMRADALIAPRPLPPDPLEMTSQYMYGEGPGPAQHGGGFYPAAGGVGGLSGSGGRVAAAAAAAGPYDTWGGPGLQQYQQGARIPSDPGARAAAAAVAGRDNAAAAAAADQDGWLVQLLSSIGLLHGARSGYVQLANVLVQQRLVYLSRYGVLLWDVTGSPGMSDADSEGQFLSGASRNNLLIANVAFAVMTGACCILYGTIGPLGSYEPQVWGVCLAQIAWLVYLVGLNPFCDVLVTAVEVLTSLGQILISSCALMGIVQGVSVMSKARLVSLCGFAGVVLFMTVVECVRAVVLVISAWYAVRKGTRKRRRVAPFV